MNLEYLVEQGYARLLIDEGCIPLHFCLHTGDSLHPSHVLPLFVCTYPLSLPHDAIACCATNERDTTSNAKNAQRNILFENNNECLQLTDLFTTLLVSEDAVSFFMLVCCLSLWCPTNDKRREKKNRLRFLHTIKRVLICGRYVLNASIFERSALLQQRNTQGAINHGGGASGSHCRTC